MRYETDLFEMKKLLNFCQSTFSVLCENQESIVSSYNELARLWSDRVYVITGQVLRRVGESLRRAYDDFRDTVRVLEKRHGILCEYQGIEADPVRLTEEFPVHFITENEDASDGRMSVSADDVLRFERVLEEYISVLDEAVKRLEAEYEAAFDYWRDEQYARFGDELATFTQSVKKQSAALRDLLKLLSEKRVLLEEAEH